MLRVFVALSALSLLALASPVQAAPGCSDVTASDGTVINLHVLDGGVHVWEHDGAVEVWLETNGLNGLQYQPCMAGGTLQDADSRVL